MALRSYAGAAKRTTLAGDITATSTNILVADATGYPTGVDGPFAVAFALGNAAEEKVLIASRSGNTLTVATGGRGYDGTSAADHRTGTSVDHVLTATDVREANAHVNDTTGDPHPQYLTPTEANAAYVAKADNLGEGFRAYRGVAQTLAAATLTKIVFDVEQRDDGADYDPATGTWTVPETGWYDVAAAVAFPSVAAGERTIASIAVAGSEASRLDDATAGSATSATRGGALPMHLTAGQLVTVLAFRGNAGDVSAGSHLTWFTAKRRH